MDKDTTVNRVLRDMNMQGLITTDVYGNVRSGEARILLNALYVAAWEQRGKELLAHNNRKVLQYNREGVKVGEFNSIKEAAKATNLNRDVIDRSISGRNKYTREQRYYFRYAETNK